MRDLAKMAGGIACNYENHWHSPGRGGNSGSSMKRKPHAADSPRHYVLVREVSGCRKLYCPEHKRPACAKVPMIRDYEQDELDKTADEIVSGYSTNYKCLSCGTRYRIETNV